MNCRSRPDGPCELWRRRGGPPEEGHFARELGLDPHEAVVHFHGPGPERRRLLIGVREDVVLERGDLGRRSRPAARLLTARWKPIPYSAMSFSRGSSTGSSASSSVSLLAEPDERASKVDVLAAARGTAELVVLLEKLPHRRGGQRVELQLGRREGDEHQRPWPATARSELGLDVRDRDALGPERAMIRTRSSGGITSSAGSIFAGSWISAKTVTRSVPAAAASTCSVSIARSTSARPSPFPRASGSTAM